MSLVYKIVIRRLIVVAYILMGLMTTAMHLHAQNVTSPYSILGIGDIDTKDVGRYSASGSASISRRNENTYNYSNPASLTSLTWKAANFELIGRGRISTYSSGITDTGSSISKDFVVRRASFAIKTGKKTGFAFGLKPFSTVNYQYTLPDVNFGEKNDSYTRNVDGSGGVNQFYASVGTALSKHFSVGLTGSFYFGSDEKSTRYIDDNLNLDITKRDVNFYNGTSILAGIQYYTASSAYWQHTIGLTFSTSSKLKGFAKTEYLNGDSDTSFLDKGDGKAVFSMPVTAAFGYTLSNKSGLSISLEGDYYRFPTQPVDYPNSTTTPAYRFSAGWEYAPNTTQAITGITYEKFYVGMGLCAQSSYFLINGNNLWDYAFSAGAGLNVLGSLYLHSAIELGVRGNTNNGMIRENYTQFVLGFTMRNFWYRQSTR